MSHEMEFRMELKPHFRAVALTIEGNYYLSDCIQTSVNRQLLINNFSWRSSPVYFSNNKNCQKFFFFI